MKGGALQNYFDRFGYAGQSIHTPPDPEVRTIIVLPSYAEPDLLNSLHSLLKCSPAEHPVEILVVINAPETATPQKQAINLESLHQVTRLHQETQSSNVRVFPLYFPSLPKKHAGVGLARKLGMDEALRRFGEVGKVDHGILLSFDADCQCQPNLLQEVEFHFKHHPKSPGASIYFEHPLEATDGPVTQDQIVSYELHLRLLLEGFRGCGVPYGFHTVGSSMACRAEAYMKQGGMNKRQAGEDFYFIQKLVQLGHYSEIQSTTIYPQPRISDRVPFGTGRALGATAGQEPYLTYAPDLYLQLKDFLDQVPQWYHDRPDRAALKEFLIHSACDVQSWEREFDNIRCQSKSCANFLKRFYRWFNAFDLIKWLNDQSRNTAPKVPVSTAIQSSWLYPACESDPKPLSILETLIRLRTHQRNQIWTESIFTPMKKGN